MSTTPDLIVIGGGLAGSEAAWQAAQRGLRVQLYEMRPARSTGAHQTSDLAELVCSNSLGSKLPDRASGVLKDELRCLDSMLLECAEAAALPAGSALAVDRAVFSRLVSKRITSHPRIEIRRQEVTEIPPGPTIIASGPLTSESLSKAIADLTGEDHLHFYDAIAPIVSLESVNMEVAFRASRYGKGEQEEGDYINCPFTQAEYEAFVAALVSAVRIPLRDFEREVEGGVKAGAHAFFEGCLPVEILARRGREALAFGPMRPVGLTDPHNGCRRRNHNGSAIGYHNGKRPYAVVQLRQDNLAGSLYNLVGFQTNLTFPEQKRVLRMIPGLENAEFVRYGQMHRNTFIAAPKALLPTLQFRSRADLFFAGQITGVEGYLGNIATGLLAGWNAARLLQGHPPIALPVTTMLGALCHYITHADLADFQPMKANFGILPPLVTESRMGRPACRGAGRRERAKAYAERARLDLEHFLEGLQ
jgi:methylenetetrahydrofolate--tRNA-(uracil-5-)-methyltransferase